MPETLYSSSQVAAILGVSVRRVSKIAVDMRVGRMVGGRYVFTDVDLERMRQRRTQPGPTPGKRKAAPSEE